LKLDKNGLNIFQIDRIPFQVSSFEYRSLKENDCPKEATPSELDYAFVTWTTVSMKIICPLIGSDLFGIIQFGCTP